MKEALARQSGYALGHSEGELDRLSRQAEVFEPFTRQLLQEAGIGRGMRVLDVGCGSGDVSFLASELVGPSGKVIGADQAISAVQRATERARARQIGNVQFFKGDPTEMQFDRPFDAVIGRFVLMYYPDPIDAIRRLAGHVRDGGLFVFQEFDLANCRSLPPAPTFERHIGWIKQTLIATGARTQLGPELYSVFVDAGLPGPSMRMDAVIGGRPDCPAFELTAEVTRSLLPAMEKLKIATAREVDISNLVGRIRDEVIGARGVVLSPGLIGAWSRKRGIEVAGMPRARD
jgi:ubiquinone/menaquinone biosynthesis C-methylase UbiE